GERCFIVIAAVPPVAQASRTPPRSASCAPLRPRSTQAARTAVALPRALRANSRLVVGVVLASLLRQESLNDDFRAPVRTDRELDGDRQPRHRGRCRPAPAGRPLATARLMNDDLHIALVARCEDNWVPRA